LQEDALGYVTRRGQFHDLIRIGNT